MSVYRPFYSYPSCDKEDHGQIADKDNYLMEDEKGGVILSFDDASIDQWLKADSVLSPYNWRATFCISHYHTLSSIEIQKLHQLENAGHEIAGHGLNHLYASEFEAQGNMQEYIELDILPMIELLKKDSFYIKSFAYPGGQRNEKTDLELLKYFKVIRGVGWGDESKDPADHNCFFENDPIVYGLGIDEQYPDFNKQSYNQHILNLLSYARDNNKILIFYAHQTVEVVNKKYQVSFSTLESICSFINDNSMKFYTLIDLDLN